MAEVGETRKHPNGGTYRFTGEKWVLVPGATGGVTVGTPNPTKQGLAGSQADRAASLAATAAAQVPYAGSQASAQARLTVAQAQTAEANAPNAQALAEAARRKAVAEAATAETAQAAAARTAEQNKLDPESLKDDIRNVIRSAMTARQLSRTKLGATGWDATLLNHPGVGMTARRDVEAALAPVAASTAIQRLKEMKNQGVVLTPISNVDLEVMKNSIASLDPTQSDASFQKSMDKIIQHFGNAYTKLGGDINEFTPKMTTPRGFKILGVRPINSE